MRNKHVTITCFFSLTEANGLRNLTLFGERLNEEGFPSDHRAGGDGEGAAIGSDELVARRQREQIGGDALDGRRLGPLRVSRHRVDGRVVKPDDIVSGTVVANHLLGARGVGGDDGRRSVPQESLPTRSELGDVAQTQEGSLVLEVGERDSAAKMHAEESAILAAGETVLHFGPNHRGRCDILSEKLRIKGKGVLVRQRRFQVFWGEESQIDQKLVVLGVFHDGSEEGTVGADTHLRLLEERGNGITGQRLYELGLRGEAFVVLHKPVRI